MVALSRDELTEQAQIAAELEDFIEDEDRVLASISGDNPQPSKFIDENHSPTRLVTIYVKETGEPRKVPAWTLDGKNSILRRKRPNGQREFVTRPDQADAVFKGGDVMCLLHPKHPRRAEFDAMGLQGKTCGALTGKHAGNLASEFARDIHMEHRHHAEWQTIQRFESKQREDMAWKAQQAQVDLANALIEMNQPKGKKASE